MQETQKQLGLAPEAGFDIRSLEQGYIAKLSGIRHKQLSRLGILLSAQSTELADLISQRPDPELANGIDTAAAEMLAADTAVSLIRICALLEINLNSALENWSEDSPDSAAANQDYRVDGKEPARQPASLLAFVPHRLAREMTSRSVRRLRESGAIHTRSYAQAARAVKSVMKYMPGAPLNNDAETP